MGLSWNVQHIPVAGLLYSNRTGRANPPAVIQPVWAGPLVVSGRQCANCENEPRAGACLEKPQIKRVKSGTWPGWLVRVGRGFSNLAAGNNSSTISVSGSTVKRARLDGPVSAPGPISSAPLNRRRAVASSCQNDRPIIRFGSSKDRPQPARPRRG